MKEYLTEDTLFNTVAMVLQGTDRLLLIVEGPHDQLLLREFVNSDLQLIAATGGKEQALGAASRAFHDGIERVRFLVDRDFDDYLPSRRAFHSNVFMSDRHDIFLDLLSGDRKLLQRVIDVHTDSARRDNTRTRAIPAPSELESEAFGLAVKLSASRILNTQRDLGLKFKRFSFGGLNPRDFDARKIAIMVLARSEYSGNDHEQIADDIAAIHEQVCGLEHAPVGDHDLFAALARVMKLHDIAVSDEMLQRGYILKATLTAMSRSAWFRQIEHWSKDNGKRGFVLAEVSA